MDYDGRFRGKSSNRKRLGMRTLRKFRFIFRNFLKTREQEIEAFSLSGAITRLFLLYPIADILSVVEVDNEFK